MTAAGLIALSGLPGVGKSTLARKTALATGAVWLRIDTIEQAILNSALHPKEAADAGYRVALAVAGDHLALGRWVIADCVNPWMETRNLWRDLALTHGASLVEAEVICSDAALHRARVEGRAAEIAGHMLPTWEEVAGWDYRPWTRDRLVVDTAAGDPGETLLRAWRG